MDDIEKINIALVGCGSIASNHINGYRSLHMKGLDIFNIKAVCDVSKAKAEEKASEIRRFQDEEPRVYISLDEMLKNESLDAADICVPHNIHHIVSSRCFEKGLDIIIEKPLGITMRAAKKIIDAAERNGRILAVAENYRRRIQSRIGWWVIREGLIGKPRIVLWTLTYWMPDPWGWRENKLIAGGSWVFDGGVHLADLDRYHLGVEALEVYAQTETFEPVKRGVKVTVDDMTMAIIKYEDRIYAQWLWMNSAPAHKISMRVIYGSNGALTEEELKIQREDHVEVYSTPNLIRAVKGRSMEQWERWFPKGITDTFATELYDFYEALTNKRKPEVDGLEAYRDMAIPIGFYESATLQKPVKIKDIEELRIEEYQSEINENLNI